MDDQAIKSRLETHRAQRLEAQHVTQIGHWEWEIALQSANDAIIVCNHHGNIVSWNRGAQAIFGYVKEEALNATIFLLIPECYHAAYRNRLVRYRSVSRPRVIRKPIELCGLRKNGSEFPAELTIIIWEAGTERFFGGIIRDISAHKQIEAQLAQQAEEQRRSNADLEQFAYIASHDLREPLRKIQTFGVLLEQAWEDGVTDEAHDYLERMIKASKRMQALISELLTFSRVTSARQPRVAVDLHEVVREVLVDLEMQIRQTGGRVIVEKLPVVKADPIQMRQLLQNLIGNGLKFHRANCAPVVTVSGRNLPGRAGNHTKEKMCELVVEDQGIGFDNKDRERIFGIFHRLHGLQEYDGTGIGLAICRKIAVRHGGSITAEGKPGCGARFVVVLPGP